MQYNINVANGTGMEVRTNLNLAHQSLATNFFGATDPSTMSPVCAFPGSTWADTGNGLLKVRNADDSDWIVIGTIEADGTPKLNASGINNTPSGTISATDVQSAINSLNVFPLRQPSTTYTANSVTLCQGLPSLAYLSCTTAGTTDSGDITIPSPVAVGDTITDGTVVWTVTQGSLSSGGLYLRQPSTAVSVGDVSYSSLLPSWARLLCTTAGTTDSGDLSVILPISEGDTIADGTVTWTVQNVTNTANRTLSNLDTANLACHVVVDSYYDNTTGDWWREYDDGWIEQGGTTNGTGSYGVIQINLLKPFNDDKYLVLTSGYKNHSDASFTSSATSSLAAILSNSGGVGSVTTTSFKTANEIQVWYACGMGASV